GQGGDLPLHHRHGRGPAGLRGGGAHAVRRRLDGVRRRGGGVAGGRAGDGAGDGGGGLAERGGGRQGRRAVGLTHLHPRRRLRQVLPECPLVELRDGRALQLVALVEEGEAEA